MRKRGRVARRGSRKLQWAAAAAIVMVASTGATPAEAQLGDARWTLTPSAGTSFGSDVDGPGAAVALGVGRTIASRVALEGEVGWLSGLALNGRSYGATALFGGRVMYLVGPLAGPLVPYGSVGGLLARLDPPASSTSVEIALTAGGGGLVRVHGRAWIRGDLRFVHVNDAPNFWRALVGLTVGLD
ncbi:MAG: hypothetical protein QF463_06175 [Vicinamibacterales bacterium]|jgi:hypothetical protein|nr:hypothetical protein [Acidobacteriota bacterium]MDP6372810.1 hypothetical protein [Vicinamibacterales bacterium]MDP6608636.1 hypothetical protein [Vicinamibacterales bacterium]HAK54549.1 hypothetical protein [Acidobacteriota bacterium]|tara:strand:+ start:5723 stop:6280 length:558 start_codon:yes stop_codon:yes gene_type:complete